LDPPILLQNQANPQILLHFQAKVTDSLQKSGAQRSRAAGSRSGLVLRSRGGRTTRLARNPFTSSGYAQENPIPTRSGYRAEGTFVQLVRS